MKKVRNISDITLSIEGVGSVEAGAVIEVPCTFHNANFVEVDKPEEGKRSETKAPRA